MRGLLAVFFVAESLSRSCGLAGKPCDDLISLRSQVNEVVGSANFVMIRFELCML